MKTKDRFEEEILKEIREIPHRNRTKVSEFIHHLRLKTTPQEGHKDINRFAGMWRDLPQKEIDMLLSAYNNRDSYFQERQIS